MRKVKDTTAKENMDVILDGIAFGIRYATITAIVVGVLKAMGVL